MSSRSRACQGSRWGHWTNFAPMSANFGLDSTKLDRTINFGRTRANYGPIAFGPNIEGQCSEIQLLRESSGTHVSRPHLRHLVDRSSTPCKQPTPTPTPLAPKSKPLIPGGRRSRPARWPKRGASSPLCEPRRPPLVQANWNAARLIVGPKSFNDVDQCTGRRNSLAID